MTAKNARRDIALAKRGAGLALAAAVLALAGCVDAFVPGPSLPESANVDSAPWPRLIDSPAPEASALGGSDDEASYVAARGLRIQEDMEARLVSLQERADDQRARLVVESSLRARARRVRARGAKLQNTPFE